MVGKTLGPYKILEPLGAGGMGEVYRARDTKLDRDVAIKVLPEDFAADPDRLARFEREAKLLASLNHATGRGISMDEPARRLRAPIDRLPACFERRDRLSLPRRTLLRS